MSKARIISSSSASRIKPRCEKKSRKSFLDTCPWPFISTKLKAYSMSFTDSSGVIQRNSSRSIPPFPSRSRESNKLSALLWLRSPSREATNSSLPIKPSFPRHRMQPRRPSAWSSCPPFSRPAGCADYTFLSETKRSGIVEHS